MLRGRSLFLSICALILATVGSAGAQEFRATVKGQVADTSDAALPGATVTVQNQDTNEIATAVTNTDGAYTLPFLRPGLYTLTVEMSGFQKNIRKDMRLEVGQVATVNVQLGVGLTETVNVSSEAPLLETSNAPIAARSSTAPASPNCRCSRAARWRSPCSSPASTTTPRPSTCARSTTARSPTGR